LRRRKSGSMEEMDDGSEAAEARMWESGLGAILMDLLNILIVLGGLGVSGKASLGVFIFYCKSVFFKNKLY
jgi:hypothetical protein